MSARARLPLALTLGEPAGIGPDLTLAIWRRRRELDLPPFYVVGEAEFRRSLPSGHASFAMLIAASLWPMLGRWQRWAALFFVAWVGVSRVNVGAHFPADVLASWLTALPAVLLARGIVGKSLGLVRAVRQRRPPIQRP